MAGQTWPPSARSRRPAKEPTRQNTETRKRIISARLSRERLQHAGRSRRVIENCLLRAQDVTMNQDQQQNRKGNRPEFLAMMRRFALNPARLEPTKDPMRCIPKCASLNDDILLKIIRATKPRPQKAITLPWTARVRRPGCSARNCEGGSAGDFQGEFHIDAFTRRALRHRRLPLPDHACRGRNPENGERPGAGAGGIGAMPVFRSPCAAPARRNAGRPSIPG